MTEMKRTFHKQRKWICPKCGAVRFQQKQIRKSKNARYL